jgi:hypothetical protein
MLELVQRARVEAHATQLVVVQDRELAGGGAAYVELDHVCAELHRQLEGAHRVLGRTGGVEASVSDYQWSLRHRAATVSAVPAGERDGKRAKGTPTRRLRVGYISGGMAR